MSRLLLVSPVFHGYWRSIQAAFEDRGHDVITHCYDAAPRHEKVWNKLRHELPARLSGQQRHLSPEVVTQRAIAALRQHRPDRVLVVRGDVLLQDFWDEVHRLGARPAAWFYDELRRMRYREQELEALGAPIATYSAVDAEALAARGLQSMHVPLAFDPTLKPKAIAPGGEFTFIGARYGRREGLMRALVDAGLPARAYGRDWSHHPVDRLRTFRRETVPVPAGRDLPLEEAYRVMAASLGALNVHGDQDGFTMRTFEAAGVGAVQLVDRDDVAQFYEPGREVLVFGDEEDLVRQCRDVLASQDRMAALRQAAADRTLAEHTFRHRAALLEQLWA